MSAILGIDAAWTPKGSSGVALIRRTSAGGWECVKVEAGYAAFLRGSNGLSSDDQCGLIPAKRLIEYAQQIAKTPIALVVADIPLSRNSITGLRFADLEVGRRFGAYGCAAHSPSPTRPGPVSEYFRDGFGECGFSLTTCTDQLPSRALIETYPHPALLSLLNANYRVRYKVHNTKRYWPDADKPMRVNNLLRVLQAIRVKLAGSIDDISFEVPEFSKSFSNLKQIEDKIDALVCAWVGIQVLDGKAEAIGDESAAIWLPRQ